MMRRAAAVLLASSMAASLVGVGAADGQMTLPARKLAIAGTGAALAITRHLAAAFTDAHRDIRVEVPGSVGSTGGIRAVYDGAVDLGVTSRPLTEDERALGLVAVPFVLSPLIIGAHPGVPDGDVSSAALVEIYRGTRTRWSDGHEIVVLNRELGDANVALIALHVPGFGEAFMEAARARRWTVFYTHHDMIRALAMTPFSIGTTDGCSVAVERLPIKTLALDGVAPTAEQMRARRYPLVRHLALVHLADRLSPEARAYLRFVRSPEGRDAIRRTGCVPA
jgi:phosphate transport system substrate-binding protein